MPRFCCRTGMGNGRREVPIVRICENCGRQSGTRMMRCRRCKQAFYCGAACQRAQWKGHKRECYSVSLAAVGHTSGHSCRSQLADDEQASAMPSPKPVVEDAPGTMAATLHFTVCSPDSKTAVPAIPPWRQSQAASSTPPGGTQH